MLYDCTLMEKKLKNNKKKDPQSRNLLHMCDD